MTCRSSPAEGRYPGSAAVFSPSAAVAARSWTRTTGQRPRRARAATARAVSGVTAPNPRSSATSSGARSTSRSSAGTWPCATASGMPPPTLSSRPDASAAQNGATRAATRSWSRLRVSPDPDRASAAASRTSRSAIASSAGSWPSRNEAVDGRRPGRDVQLLARPLGGASRRLSVDPQDCATGGLAETARRASPSPGQHRRLDLGARRVVTRRRLPDQVIALPRSIAPRVSATSVAGKCPARVVARPSRFWPLRPLSARAAATSSPPPSSRTSRPSGARCALATTGSSHSVRGRRANSASADA